ncbi:hypothetical protein [Methylobacterium tarhaniae]|uniref:hypothetical protein n=1 Tax=Methylobacterium tarhaniae TaxID=1187852 RepID=UPI003CFDFD78
MDKDAFLAWGWRLPFLASAVLLVVGFVIRVSVSESPDFERARADRRADTPPIVEVVTTAWKPLLLAMGANTVRIAAVYRFNTFMISYTTQYLGMARSTVLDAPFLAAVVQFFVQPVAAGLAVGIRNERLFLQLALGWAALTTSRSSCWPTCGRPGR